MRSTLLLLLVGVLFAGGLGFAAHVVAQDTVGTPAVDLDQGEPLAPEEARDDDRTESTTTTTETETEPRTTTEGDDDDNSGPGSGSSGSGSGGDDDSGQGRGRGRGRGGDD